MVLKEGRGRGGDSTGLLRVEIVVFERGRVPVGFLRRVVGVVGVEEREEKEEVGEGLGLVGKVGFSRRTTEKSVSVDATEAPLRV